MLPNKPAFSGSKNSFNNGNPTFKRAKLHNSRIIRTQINDDAFNNPVKNKKKITTLTPNKLDIPEFLASREFEIRALDSAMIKSQNSGATRVFQSLPRTLRRRTASHNVRRIPKRMRKKALREMGLKTNINGEKQMTGTSGVKVNGKPVLKKIGRGRERWKIKRELILLKKFQKLTNRNSKTYKNLGSSIIKRYGNGSNFRHLIKSMKNHLQTNKLSVTGMTKTAAEEINHLNEFNFTNLKKGKYLISEDTSINSVAKVNQLNKIKYFKRQQQFKWLPTHIWHSKRFKMIKRWQFNLPLTPTQKCFRSTSRASRIRGTMVQDTSYYGTIVVNYYSDLMKEEIFSYLSELTKKRNWKKYAEKYLSWEGFVYMESNRDAIGDAIIYMENEKLLIRLHPSIHSLVLEDMLCRFKDLEDITIHDCKYSIGSITLTGPKSVTALQTIFHAVNKGEDEGDDFNTFMKFHKLTDMNIIPNGTTFNIKTKDPRLYTSSKLPTNPKHSEGEILDLIVDLQNRCKPASISHSLLEYKNRLQYLNNLPTLKESVKIRESIRLYTDKDKSSRHHTSILLVKSCNQWIMMAPWEWIMPIWYSLVHVSHVQTGGWKENEQLKFENGKLGWSDSIFMDSAFVENEIIKDENEKSWLKKPKSKRMQYNKIKVDQNIKGELLSPFGLDLRGLQTLRYSVMRISANCGTTKTDPKMNLVPVSFEDIPSLVKTILVSEAALKKTDQHQLLLKYKPLTLITQSFEISSLAFNIKELPPLTVLPVKLECISKGHIKQNAKIYRIPEGKTSLWKDVGYGNIVNIQGKNVGLACINEVPEHLPKIQDLVGLVSTATFNLAEGKSTAVGFIDSNVQIENEVLVRNVGSSQFVLMKWNQISV